MFFTTAHAHHQHHTNQQMPVLPPANGEKRWRIKRTVSTSGTPSQESNSSLECLNNSLKISAAGKTFMTKRPPMKRPRAKPGMPKDFVFVDLSPIKSEEDAGSDVSSATSSPVMSCGNGAVHSPMSLSNDSISSVATSHDDVDYSQYNHNVLDESTLLGLGLMNINYDTNNYFNNYPQNAQHTHIDYTQTVDYSNPVADFASERHDQFSPSAPLPTPHLEMKSHKRHKSASSIPRRESAGGFQFKPYKGPLKKPQHNRKARSLSLPSDKILAAAQLSSAPSYVDVSPVVQTNTLDNHVFGLQYSPVTDVSDDNIDSLMNTMDFDINTGESFSKYFKDEFDLSSFIAL